MKLILMFSIFMSFYYFILCATPFDEDEWQSYMKKHDKKYSSDMDVHKNMYMKNKQLVEEHNKRYERKQETYRMCLNKFADMLPTEFPRHQRPITKTTKIGPKRQMHYTFEQPYIMRKQDNLSESVDWRKLGAVTDIKNQGNCGSCWAHATIGVIEGQLFQQTGQLLLLSEQQLVDCSKSNLNCFGGLSHNAYWDLNNTIGGLVTSEVYPYIGENSTFICKNKSSQSVVKVLGYRTIKEGDEIELQDAVATIGPIAIAFYSDDNFSNPNFNFSLYCGGIYSDPNCSTFKNKLNHEMLVVGYGVQNGTNYWIVKNSYGKTWGESGYVRVKRGVNTCGIASDATFPIILPTGALTNGTKSRTGSNSHIVTASTATSERNTAFILIFSTMVFLFFQCNNWNETRCAKCQH